MARDRNDTRTIDLEDWQPPDIVRRFEEQRIRTASLRARIARAVGETLRDAEQSRDEIASRMSAFLEEEVSTNMLNAYASEAREDHTISYLRLLALVHVTGDARLLELGAELVDHLVVERRFLPWIEVGMRADRRDRVQQAAEDETREFDMALRAARRGSRS